MFNGPLFFKTHKNERFNKDDYMRMLASFSHTRVIANDNRLFIGEFKQLFGELSEY